MTALQEIAGGMPVPDHNDRPTQDIMVRLRGMESSEVMALLRAGQVKGANAMGELAGNIIKNAQALIGMVGNEAVQKESAHALQGALKTTLRTYFNEHFTEILAAFSEDRRFSDIMMKNGEPRANSEFFRELVVDCLAERMVDNRLVKAVENPGQSQGM